MKKTFLYFLILLLSFACSKSPIEDFTELHQSATIYPDYSQLTIPSNIAPLNFSIQEEGAKFQVEFNFENGKPIILQTSKDVVLPLKKWKNCLAKNQNTDYTISIYRKMSGEWQKYKTIRNTIAGDSIDAYITYRLIDPLFNFWKTMGIYERNLENFEENTILYSNNTDKGCMHCHSFKNNNGNDMLFHLRAKGGGTVIIRDGEVKKINMPKDKLVNSCGYPAWHPQDDVIAFSNNITRQIFSASQGTKATVFDFKSDMTLYDLEANTLSHVCETTDKLESYPVWSADGEYLYYCCTDDAECFEKETNEQEYHNLNRNDEVSYDLVRKKYNRESKTFGDEEMIINADAMNKSIAMPRISPDGQYLMFCLMDYGTFPLFMESSELYLLDLSDNTMRTMSEVNSIKSDSYHSWSSNGRWFVFGSRRIDGVNNRIYISHIDSDGKASKPFILPQEAPDFYANFMKSYNSPELHFSSVKHLGSQLENILEAEAINADYK